MSIGKWLESLPGAPTPTEAAQKAHVSKATLFRHIEKGETTAENVIAIARAYGMRPVDALVNLGFLRPEEATSERLAIRQALKQASIAEKWDSIADDVDGQRLLIGHFPRFADLDARTFGAVSSPADADDALIDEINAGTAKVAAQDATDPIEESWS